MFIEDRLEEDHFNMFLAYYVFVLANWKAFKKRNRENVKNQ